MIRVGKQHGAILLVRDLPRNTEQPLFRNDTSSREPRRVQIKHMPMPMRVHVRMRMRGDESQSRHVVRRRGDAEQRRLQRARWHGQRGLGEHREKERERMRADAEGACDQQEGDQTRADRLEFCEAERVAPAGRPTGQTPRE